MNGTKTAMGTVAVRAAVVAALAGLAAGCGGSPPSVSASPPPTAPTSTAPMSTASAGAPAPASAPASANGSASASSSASAAGFVPIVEPFDPSHPARTQPAPADCYNLESTVDIEQCFQVKTENTDAGIDAVQQARYVSASPAGQAAILAQDRAWLNARGLVCELAFHTGGSIDIISTSACLLDESTARLYGIKGIAAPEAMFKSTDDLDPNVWSWYTTPEGSRIAELSTQGDQTGGGIIAWIIIGGADGFVINPAQFYFINGSYTNHGVVQPPNPAYHRVGTAQEYQFTIDYTHLSQAPGNPATGGFVYAPGHPVAIWR